MTTPARGPHGDATPREGVVVPLRPAYVPTDVYDELFSDEMGTTWIVKSERTPTRNIARKVVADLEGEPYIDIGCRSRRARIERRRPLRVWEVYYR